MAAQSPTNSGQYYTETINRRGTFNMESTTTLDRPHQLKLHEPKQFIFGEQTETPKTPNSWWVERYPDAYQNHGSPFLQLIEQADRVLASVLPITINHDFFAACLGGRRDLGHHVVYLENELAWYFKDSDGIFKTTSAEKLMNQYRALMMQCAQDIELVPIFKPLSAENKL